MNSIGGSMDKILIGKVVSFHGIKGELRLLSNFPYKDKCFQVGKEVIIDDALYEIASYRRHKQYDMITLKGFNDINQVLFLKNQNVYETRNMLNLAENEYLKEDLLNFEVESTDGKTGVVIDLFDSGSNHYILKVKIENKMIMIPCNPFFIQKIDPKKKIITIQLLEGM